MTKAQQVINHIQQRLGTLDAGEIEHFHLLSKALLDCYASNNLRAGVMLRNEREDVLTLIAVNADEFQLQAMVSEMSELMGGPTLQGQPLPMQLN